MFLTELVKQLLTFKEIPVAIPSNRVNVSYDCDMERKKECQKRGRNPLKSGQCFLLPVQKSYSVHTLSRNPLKSGQCFLQRHYQHYE